MRVAPLLLAIAACSPVEDELDLRDPPVELELPELAGVDLKVVYAKALETALVADTRMAWDAHVAGFDLVSPGCPDFYAGTPDLENMDVPEETGWSWADHCSTPGGDIFGGFAWWENDLVMAGDPESFDGATSTASRTLVADGVVADENDEVLWEFDGESSDSLLLVQGDGFTYWTYSSLLDGTLTGDWAFPGGADGLQGGFRADMYIRTTGGDADTLEIRGNLYFFEHRIADRFDSITANLIWGSPDSLGPDECTAEPRGWIGVRDENAFWYDLVFQPRFDDDPNAEPYQDDDYGPCDGCGTLYVRGLEQTGIEVCPDLSFLWTAGLTHPEPTEFALSMRDLLGGQQ